MTRWLGDATGTSVMHRHYHIRFNTFRPRQNGRRFADDTFKRIFLNKNVRISIKISLKFVPKGPINNNPALVQIMAWHRSGDKPLSEPMMVSLPGRGWHLIYVRTSIWVALVVLRTPYVDLVYRENLGMDWHIFTFRCWFDRAMPFAVRDG